MSGLTSSESVGARVTSNGTLSLNGELDSFNPTTGELLGSVQTVAPGTVQRVVDEVAAVQPFWAALSLDDRGRYLRRAAQVVLDELDELAGLISKEQGKPLVESYAMELVPTVDLLHWCANNGPKILADEQLQQPQLMFKQKQSFISYEPLGVVGVIGPWNYPWSIPFGEVAIALMAGNGVLLKPASLTCLVGQRIQEIFDMAGLPDGLVRTVHGGAAVGRALVESSTAKIFFTGSVDVGRQVGEQCARMMKGSVLELGGKDPQIVLADAHLPHAIAGAIWGGFANAGQTCTGIERTYVMREIAEPFIAGVVAQSKRLHVGDPLEERVSVGPMASEEQFELVKELVDDALADGAVIHCGGPVKSGLQGYFYAPTVLTGVNHGMRIMREEVFGPVLPVMIVDCEEEAIELANDCEFGLGASVWTLDRQRGTRIAHRLQAGMVWINDHAFTHGACQCSWGGVKNSGLGRSHSKFGFYECASIKNITWEPSRVRNMWWHPYDKTLLSAVRASARLLYSQAGDRLQALRRGALPLIRVAGRSARDTFNRSG